MRQAHKFAMLSAADRRLLLEAAALLGAIRLGLWLLPFRTLRHLLDRLVQLGLNNTRAFTTKTRRHEGLVTWCLGSKKLSAYFSPSERACAALVAQRSSPERIAWAIAAASSCVPATSCLVRALAAQVLLTRRGYPARLRIGVAKGDGGRLEAHAWVEGPGSVVSGGLPDHMRYVALPALDRAEP
jgi:hypothetical protein